MRSAVIVDAVRSPIGRGKPGGTGAFVNCHPVELLRQTLVGLMERNQIDPGEVEDVIVGCVTQIGEQAYLPGRWAWLGAGYPEHVPSTTVDRKCGSSQQAIHFAAQVVRSGDADIVIAGGVESMSRVAMGSNRIGQNTYGPAVQSRYPSGLVGQGIAAELFAASRGIEREAMDSYAARSHFRAAQAQENGYFDDEIVPISDFVEDVVTADETIRADTTAEGLSGLRPVFDSPELREKYPHVNWSVTAGNASQITDGASLLLIMSETKANELGLRIRARFVGFSVVGADPVLMFGAPMPAARSVLKRAGLNVDDIDQFEVNEAFAPIPIAFERELETGDERLNPIGGAIALGHPLGASGARLMTTLLNGLERGGGRYGLQSICEAGGQANAAIIEINR